MKKVAFIGSGELSFQIAHYMEEDNQYEVVGFFDDFTPVGTIVKGYKVIGTLEEIESFYKNKLFDGLVNGIGFTRMTYRKEVFDRFSSTIPFVNFIHSSCIVDSTAKIGQGVIIFPMALVYVNAIIKDNVFIHIKTSITDTIIGRDTIISGNVMVAGRCEIGEGCNVGVCTTFSSDVKVCSGVRTGAGTVVVKDITDPGTYVGVPARKISDSMY